MENLNEDFYWLAIRGLESKKKLKLSCFYFYLQYTSFLKGDSVRVREKIDVFSLGSIFVLKPAFLTQ